MCERIEPRRAPCGATARDEPAGRSEYAGLTSSRLRRRPKNGDIRTIRRSRKSVARRAAHAEKRSANVDDVKWVELRIDVAKRKISSQWLRMREGASRSDLCIDYAVHLDPLVAQRANPALEALRRAILAAHPGGQLPEIILEIDRATPNGRSSSAIGGTVEKTI